MGFTLPPWGRLFSPFGGVPLGTLGGSHSLAVAEDERSESLRAQRVINERSEFERARSASPERSEGLSAARSTSVSEWRELKATGRERERPGWERSDRGTRELDDRVKRGRGEGAERPINRISEII